MKRRDFLAGSLAATVAAGGRFSAAEQTPPADCCERTYATPAAAMQAERERLLYVTALYVGTPRQQPDYLATVDVDPESPTYSQVIHRLATAKGDELHHFGWNACSSCHGERERKFLVIPGFRSNRIYIADTSDPRQPKLSHTIEARDILDKTGLSAPHTVHCLADGRIMISMLGDQQGNGPGGFLLLDDKFRILGRWEQPSDAMKYNYDFWYQPRHNVMVSSEWGAPNTTIPGFKLEDVKAGKYGQRLHFWDWKTAELKQTIDLGQQGLIPLEVRFHHHPDSAHGFVGAALSSSMWHYHKSGDRWQADKVIEVPPVETAGWPFPVPGLITDLLLSMDDRWLYFANWLHGDLRQYDVSDPARPKLTGQVWLGGVIGHKSDAPGRQLTGGPQMLQLSLDGRRLYVTNSLFSSWDNQFYPAIAKQGSSMLQLDCDTEQGGMKINERFFVDFGKEPAGPARAHEMRFPGGDCTSDIWV